ncbi:MAG: hypothetical protein FWG10_01985 [Eubacteriaceae bacterium]|nr:hypothetical protein [Eubacteriaceae bacterium]
MSKGIKKYIINKMYEGKPNIEDAIQNHELGYHQHADIKEMQQPRWLLYT